MHSKRITESDFEYDLNEVGTGMVIKGYKEKARYVITSSSIEDLMVVELGSFAFNETKILSILMPDSIINIGKYSFFRFENLEKVRFY